MGTTQKPSSMNTFSTLSAVLLTALSAQAQPTLTFATNAPLPGTTYTLNYGPYIAPGASGANASWDFTGLTTDSSAVLQLVDPATTPYASSFPDATVAETGTDATMYFTADAFGVELAGSVSDDLVIAYSNKASYLPYPCTYQTSWTDDLAATFDADGFVFERTGTVNGEVDGYGTLTWPGGTVTDVLRVHWQESFQDSGFFLIEGVNDGYLYYVAGTSYPLIQVVNASVTLFGNTETVQFTQWLGGLTTAIADPVVSTNAPLIFPNPATDRFTITDDGEEWSSVALVDATGRTVHALGNRTGRVTLEVADLPRGLYLLELVNGRGQRHVERVHLQ